MLGALAAFALSARAEDRILTLADGTELRYGLHVPEEADDRPLPLVVGLHYGWGRGPGPPPYYGRDYMNVLARPGLADLEAIIVAPDCPGRGWADPRSDAAVMELIEAVQREFAIDADRIVVTGYSMGGMGTWSFVARHPNLVSAAIPMAGRPTAEILADWGRTPVFAVHGVEDEVVPIGPTRDAVAELQLRGVEARLVEVPAFAHFQTARFAQPMQAAVAWLRRVWDSQAR